LDTGFCIFHDENYLQDKNNLVERKKEVTKRLMDKVAYSIDHNKALFCIGYHLPDIKIKARNFTKPVYFSHATFQDADFSGAKFSQLAYIDLAEFSGKAYFYSATFSEGANFNHATFSGEAYFDSAKFSQLAYFSSAKFSGEAYFRHFKIFFWRICYFKIS
jgi:hypothetical protein